MTFPLNTSSLNTAANAISAEQQIMNIIDQNVANVNTPGYSRQEGILQTTIPYPPSNYPNPGFLAGQMGTGTEVASVQRYRLESLETLYRNENQSVGSLTSGSQLLQQIQAVLGEPGTSGISSLMQNFFQSLQSLSQNPNDAGVRNAVLQSANQLANGFHSLDQSIQGVIASANTQVTSDVQQINNLANQVAALNNEIRQVQAVPGQNANDLLDQRGQLLQQLSNLVNIQVSLEPNGSSIVSIGGDVLVQDDKVNQLGTFTDSQGRTQVQFTSQPGLAVPLQGGQLFGVINTRDNVLGSISTSGTLYFRLNEFANQFVQNVNSISQLGFTKNGTTGLPLFSADPDNDADVDAGIGVDGDADAASINWLSGIRVAVTDPNNIAASVASVTSVQNVNNLSQTVDQTRTLAAQSSAFLTAPAASGTITINGKNINWNNGETINQILQDINNSGAGVTASFDAVSQTFTLRRDTTTNQNYAGGFPGNSQIAVSDAAGNLSQVFLINTTNNALTGTAAVNTTGTPGDNTNVNFLTGLQNASIAALGSVSLTQFYQQIVGDVGNDTQQAQTNLTAGQSVLQQLDQQRQSISGVNLNEEAVKLSQTQQAFNAAARVETAIDAMLTRLIDNTGLPAQGG